MPSGSSGRECPAPLSAGLAPGPCRLSPGAGLLHPTLPPEVLPSCDPPVLGEGVGWQANPSRPQQVLTRCLALQGKGLPGPPVSTDHPCVPHPSMPTTLRARLAARSQTGVRVGLLRGIYLTDCRVPVPSEGADQGCVGVLRALWVQTLVSHFLTPPAQGEAGESGVPGGVGLRGPPVSGCPNLPPLLRAGALPVRTPPIQPPRPLPTLSTSPSSPPFLSLWS